MAPGFRSLAGFPLGAGKTDTPPDPEVGFISPLWWMAGLDGGFIPPDPPATRPDGDGDIRRHRGVRPIAQIRPKVERDLDDALEIIEAIEPTRRVKENKAAAREALATIRAAEIPISFEEPIAKIEKGLKQLSRNAAKHEGMQEAAMRVAAELEAVIAEMERQRKRRQRDDGEAIWLLLH